MQESGSGRFSAAIDGTVYAKHGTSIDTRLTVIDRVPADDLTEFPASPALRPTCRYLLDWVMQYVRRATSRWHVAAAVPAIASPSTPRTVRATSATPASCGRAGLDSCDRSRYEQVDWIPSDASKITDALYEAYTLQSIRIPGALAHRRSSCSRQPWPPSRRQAVLPTTSPGQPCREWPPVGPPARDIIMLARRTRRFSPAPGRLMRL